MNGQREANDKSLPGNQVMRCLKAVVGSDLRHRDLIICGNGIKGITLDDNMNGHAFIPT